MQRSSRSISQLQPTGPHVRGLLPLCREAVGVFYSPRRQDKTSVILPFPFIFIVLSMLDPLCMYYFFIRQRCCFRLVGHLRVFSCDRFCCKLSCFISYLFEQQQQHRNMLSTCFYLTIQMSGWKRCWNKTVPYDWGCTIHRLLLCRGVRPPTHKRVS